MKYFSIITTIFVLIGVISCTKDIGPDPALSRTINCDTISFTKHIKPIIEANCIGCHTPNGGGNGDFTTDMYPVLKQKADNGSLLGRAVDLTITPTMPYGMNPLPENKREILRCWINAGAPNN